MNRAAAVSVLIVLLCGSLIQTGLVLSTVAADHDDDPYDGRPQEWEKQVAQDARGDVLITWPGSIDLLYMTMGNLHSLNRGETFLFIRIGYNITHPGHQTLVTPQENPAGVGPDLPPLADERPLAMINITFNVTHDGETRSERISLFTFDYGEFWGSDQGLLVSDNPQEDREDKEVLYAAPLRRFGLEPGDVLSDYNVSSYRNGRLVDTMHGFDPANDYLPGYPAIHPLLQDPQSALPPLPLPFPAPDPPEPPLPDLPEQVPDPTDIVPNRPYPQIPSPGDQGLPKGTPHPDDLEDWDPDKDGPVPWDPQKIVGGVTNPESGAATSVEFTIEEGTSRFIVRSHQEILRASIDQVGYGNFTVDNLMTETDQRVGLFWSGPPGMRWTMRYGLDMPTGVKSLPADGQVDMSLIAVPNNLFARPVWAGTAIFISDWGGIEVVGLTLQSTTERMEDPRHRGDRGVVLPENPSIQIMNPESHYRENERRNILVQVRDADTGLYVSDLRGVRAFIYPEGATPGNLPYQLREKPWMDGIYEVPFVFDRPGAWHMQVFLFDYPPDADGGGWPHDGFVIRVDYKGESPPLMPLSLALLSVGLIVTAVWARERIGKSR